jgi:hypothetical protein
MLLATTAIRRIQTSSFTRSQASWCWYDDLVEDWASGFIKKTQNTALCLFKLRTFFYFCSVGWPSNIA